MQISLKAVVRIGGALNLLMALFHIYLCYMIYNNYSAETFYPLLQMFAIGGMIMIFYLAVSSMLYPTELIGSALGSITIILNILIYGTRVIGELVLFPKPKPVIIIICVIMTVLYFYVFFKARKVRYNN